MLKILSFRWKLICIDNIKGILKKMEISLKLNKIYRILEYINWKIQTYILPFKNYKIIKVN
jgi:hypothetical protein